MIQRLFLLLALTLAVLTTLPLVALVAGADYSDIVAALGDADVVAAIARSLGCASASVVLSLLLGVPAGYVLARRLVPWTGFWQALLDLPVVVPHPLIGLGLLLVFARRSLLGAALTHTFGIEIAAATPGIILAMLVVSVPFVVKGARDGFLHVPQALERAAQSLGASEARVFFSVSLPLAATSIRSGAVLAWARAVSEFGSIVILAYYPRTAPVLIWDRFSTHGLRAALAPAVLLLAACMAIFVLLHLTWRRGRAA